MEFDPDNRLNPKFRESVREKLKIDASLPREFRSAPRVPNELARQVVLALEGEQITVPSFVERDLISGQFCVEILSRETPFFEVTMTYDRDWETPADDRKPCIILMLHELGNGPYQYGAPDDGFLSLIDFTVSLTSCSGTIHHGVKDDYSAITFYGIKEGERYRVSCTYESSDHSG